MSKDKNKSEFQDMFTTQWIFRRNRHHYDAIKVAEQERQNELKRRNPNLTNNHQSQHITKGFQSAKKQLENKLQGDITKYKFRMSSYSTQDINPEEQSSRSKDHEEKSPRNIKGISHDKLQSRQNLYKLKNKPCLDERQFNNFAISNNDLSKTPNIGKYSPRNLNIALEHINDLSYDSHQKYQQLYFDKRTTSCVFNLKKQNDQQPRYFFIPQKPENTPSTLLQPQSVAKSFSVATPFKPNKIAHFYKLNGRQLPCQMDQRYLSPNHNFYKDNEGKLINQKASFTSRRYKDQMIARDLEEIRKSKKPYFNRNQICDQRYFKQYIKQF